MPAERPAGNAGGPIMRNSALNAVAGMATLVTGFVSAVIVARLLGPEANGTVAFAIWLAMTGSLVAELGTGISLLRILPQLRLRGFGDQARLRFAAWLAWPVTLTTLAIAAVYGLVIWYSGGAEWAGSAHGIVVITAILFIVQSVGSFSKNYLIGEQRLESFLKLSSLGALLQLVVIAIATWFWGISGALIGYLAGQILLFASTLKVLARRPDSCGINVRQFIGSSTIVIIEFAVTAIFLNRPEILFLQQLHSVETIGYYAVALSLANLALQLPIQLTGSMMPYYASHLEANGGTLPEGIFEGAVRNFAFLTLPMSFGLAAIAKPLVTGIYGEAFEASGPIVAILALGTPAAVFLQLCSQYVFSIDKPIIRLHTAIGGALIMGLGCLAAIPFFGAEGAAFARFVSFLAMCVYIVRHMELPHSLMPVYGALLRIGAASALTGLAAFAAVETVPGLAGVALGIVAGVVVYIPALRLMRAVSAADSEKLASKAGRLPPIAGAILNQMLKLVTSPNVKTAV